MTESAAALVLKAEACPVHSKDIYPERSRGASPPSAPAARTVVQLTQGMPYLAFGETVSAPPAMPLSAPRVDEDAGAGESAAEPAPEVCAPMIAAPVDWALAGDPPDEVRPGGTVVTVEPSSTST